MQSLSAVRVIGGVSIATEEGVMRSAVMTISLGLVFSSTSPSTDSTAPLLNKKICIINKRVYNSLIKL